MGLRMNSAIEPMKPALRRRMPGALARLVPAGWRRLVRDYMSAISGSLGRLVFSLAYFVILANTLTIADFGLFATASATGVVLSRIVAFGFSSPLYRAATMRPRLIGLYAGGYLAMAAASLPVLALAAGLAYAIVFSGEMALATFALIIVTEALIWRSAEIVVIVNNGMGRFGRAAILVICGTALRAAAALGFWLVAAGDSVSAWAPWYAAANLAVLAISLAWFFPRHRLRFHTGIVRRRLTDSLSVAGAEILFYLQMELDKLLVLALGGPTLAGLYAIIMRLVDLTAIPMRTFNMMLVQAIMRRGGEIGGVLRRIGFETGIFAISTAGMAFIALMLAWRPDLMGRNVAEAAPILLLALLIPGFRNLTEYHAELLYARGQSFRRAINLAVLAVLKAGLLTLLLAGGTGSQAGIIGSLTWAFGALYLASMLLTYPALRQPARPL